MEATGSLKKVEYDLLGRMTACSDYAGMNADGTGASTATMSRTTFLYDAQGLLLKQETLHGVDHAAGAGTTAKSEAIDYVYDGLGRLLDVIRHDGGTTYVRGTTNPDALNLGESASSAADHVT